MRQKNSQKFLLALYVALAVYLLPMFPHGGSANELTRWATAASLIEKGSFEISWTRDLIGENVDTAKIGENTYSNKAPGPAILAAPIYALVRLFTGPPDASNIRITWFAMRFGLSTLPLLFLAVWLYRRDADEFALAILLFGTPLFLYSLLFFSHVLVAVLIYFAFRLLYDRSDLRIARYFWAGALSGLAVISEFPAIFAVAVFGIGLFFTEKSDRLRRILFFLIGGAPFLAFLLIYNYSLFGSPFSMSYAHESFPEWAQVAGQGVFGIGIPSISNAFLLLLSPSRGLFFCSPILVLSVVCFFTSRERSTLRHKVKICAIAVTILLLCGHGAAHGGWVFGARYLIFVLPLLLDSFFNGETNEMPSIWKGFLFAISFLLCVMPALTFPFAPPEFDFPHNNFWGSLLGTERWFTPNLANVFGFNGIFTLLPAVLCFLAAIYILWKSMLRPGRFAIGLAAGFILVGTYIFLPNLDNDQAGLRRATIAERFFKPGNRLAVFRDNARAKNDWKALRAINDSEWNIADTRAFAPNDFPYLDTRESVESPTAVSKKAIDLEKAGKISEAETLLKNAEIKMPFAACEFSTDLAVIYYSTNRKDLALSQLESVHPLVNEASTPDCMRSEFLLGSLYEESGRIEDAQKAYRDFLSNSTGSTDDEIKRFRQKLLRK